MAQTISELEKERAELLKAIEDQAQSMSSSRAGGPDSTPEHTLKDWLNAAEEVMPNRPRNRTNPEPQPQAKPETAKNNRASFFGVIIMLSLLLTILGVVYIAYTSIHNELKSVMAIKDSSSQDIQQLKASIAKLEKATAANGKGELFTQLQNRVASIETEIKQLKQSMAVPAQSAD
ncbi:MAG: hypothetical protein R3219_07495, partial [Hydrogenovibrio sp.]|nr:hypothetical protein [Hydrogenovibrio sp.]